MDKIIEKDKGDFYEKKLDTIFHSAAVAFVAAADGKYFNR